MKVATWERAMGCVSRGLFLILFCLTMGCGDEETPALKASAETRPARRTNVSVYTIKSDSLVQHSRLPAAVQAWRDVTVGALEPGVVIKISKSIGDSVQRGDVLARLNLEVLEAAAIEAEANLKFQAYNYERSQDLFAEGSISEQAHREAEYDYRRAESSALTLRRRLSYGTIRAPFDGQVAQRFIELGQLVAQGGPTFRLVQTDSLRVEAWVSETEIIDFFQGRTVDLTLDAFPGRVFAGTIGHIGPAAQSDQRVFSIEVHLPNATGQIRPGMIGKIRSVRRVYNQVVAIPREAVLERETGPAAFVVENDQARLKNLTLGPSEADRVVVREGLQFGDRLIVKGGRDLIDGDRVDVQYTEKMP